MREFNEKVKFSTITSCADVLMQDVEELLAAGVPQIFFIDTREERCDLDTFIYLSDEDKNRMQSLKKESDQNNYRVTHSLINYIYSYLLKCSVVTLPYRLGRYKKPYIRNGFNYHFNISHSGNCAIVGLLNNELGVDIEYYDEQLDFVSITNGLFSTKDKQYIQRERKNFFRLWVAKEAYLKFKGTGFYRDINSIEYIGEGKNQITLLDMTTMSEHSVAIFDEQEYFIGLSYVETKNGG